MTGWRFQPTNIHRRVYWGIDKAVKPEFPIYKKLALFAEAMYTSQVKVEGTINKL